MAQEPYTVARLIADLQKEDPNRIIVAASDPAGNDYSPVVDISTCKFDFEDSKIGLETLTPELIAKGYSDEDVKKNGTPAICLWP